MQALLHLEAGCPRMMIFISFPLDFIDHHQLYMSPYTLYTLPQG